MAELVLVLGGTRSGKSAVAEALVAQHPHAVYVGTSVASDAEMAQRIAQHRARRPAHWETVEAEDLAAAVAAAPPQAAVLIDGLGAWLARRMESLGMFAGDRLPDARLIGADIDRLVTSVREHRGPMVVVVAEDAGAGVVSPDAGTRLWVDLLGTCTQQVSRAAARALLVHAGRAVALPPAPAVGGTATPVPDLRAHGDTMVPRGALDFAVNIHGDGPPDHLQAVLASTDAGGYPDPARAVEALARRHVRPPDEVLVTAGAAEAFWLLAGVAHVRRAVVVHPQFTEPEAALRAHGITVDHVFRSPDDDWALHPDAIPDDADLVVVGSPNNPTGTMDDPRVVAQVCRPGRITVVDEAFADFVADPGAGVAGRPDLPGLVVVRSVTKLWGLAGVRAGYLLAPPGLVRRCAALRQPWAVGAQALAALEHCAADEVHRRAVAAEVAGWRANLLAGLRRIPAVTAWEGAANFVLVRVPDGARVHRALLAEGIAVRPSTFPGLSEDYLRIAVRPAESTAILLTALQSALAGAGV